MQELRHVMYVDDEPDLRTLVEVSLKMLGGLEVTLCKSGEEAVATAERERPDLILLDMMMPGMDGLQTLHAIRAAPNVRNLPVIFITAKIQTSEYTRLQEADVLDVIAKPFDVMTLADQLQKIWAKHLSSSGD